MFNAKYSLKELCIHLETILIIDSLRYWGKNHDACCQNMTNIIVNTSVTA